MKEKIFSHLISATITFRMIVYCNSIFDGNIIFMGYRTKTENHGNSRVWQAPPRMEFQGGGGGMDIFWNYTLKKHNGGEQKLFSAVRYGTNVSISVHTTGIFLHSTQQRFPDTYSQLSFGTSTQTIRDTKTHW